MILNPDIISLQSSLSVEKTIIKLKNSLTVHGITIYAHIDQQEEASKSGLFLKPLQLLIFGNPRGGIPLMNANPLSGLDLPLKVLVWEDDEKKVWLSYNKFSYLQNRFDLPSYLIEKLSAVEPMFQNVIGPI
ncbi:MAG TPA: DUF302 domain-containing protein [Puia sp.]|jgi:uncharacterized protein (DUF302 family)|nr:DUF302 domain-containing protein [Puia sp.]